MRSRFARGRLGLIALAAVGIVVAVGTVPVRANPVTVGDPGFENQDISAGPASPVLPWYKVGTTGTVQIGGPTNVHGDTHSAQLFGAGTSASLAQDLTLIAGETTTVQFYAGVKASGTWAGTLDVYLNNVQLAGEQTLNQGNTTTNPVTFQLYTYTLTSPLLASEQLLFKWTSNTDTPKLFIDDVTVTQVANDVTPTQANAVPLPEAAWMALPLLGLMAGVTFFRRRNVMQTI